MRSITANIFFVVGGIILLGWQPSAVVFAASELETEALLTDDRALSDAWDSAVGCLDNEDYSTATSYLQHVVEHKKTNGVRNLYLLADILNQRLQIMEKVPDAEAERLMSLARTLAPDLPRTAFTASTLHGWSKPGVAISDLVNGVSLSWVHVPTRVLLTGRVAMACILAILVTLFLLALSFLVRYGDRFVHQMSHLVPKAFRGIPLGIVLFAAITIVPFSLGAGIAVIAMLWLLLLWPYFSRRERIVSGLLMLVTASIPLLNMIYAGALDYPALSDSVVYECMTGSCSATDRERLKKAIDSGEKVHYANVAMGLHYKRVASRDASANAEAYRLAEKYFQAALAYDEKSYMATVNLANLRYTDAQQQCRLQGPGAVPDLDAVNQLYAEAAKLSLVPVEAEYNRSVLHRHLGLDSEAAYFRAQATALNAEKVIAWEAAVPTPSQEPCPVAFNANVDLMDVTVPGDVLWSELWEHRPVTDALLVPYGRLLVGSVQSLFFLPYGLACALLLFVSGYLTRFMRPAKRCKACGRVTCERCRKEVKYLDICPRCVEIRLKGAFVDSRQRWLQERERIELQVRGTRALLWWSVLFPGLTQLSVGRCISGMLYAFSFTMVAVLSVAGPYLISERAPSIGEMGFGAGLLMILACILYLSSLLGAIRMRRKA